MSTRSPIRQRKPVHLHNRKKKASIWLLLLPVLLSVVLYLNSLDNGLTYDDFRIVVKNPCVSGAVSLSEAVSRDVWCLGGSEATGSWRPISTLILRGLHATFGLWPQALHGVSLFIYTLTVLFVTLLSRQLTGSIPAAVLAGMLYAAHPVHTEAVDSIAALSELLAAFCIFAALALHATLLSSPLSVRRRWVAFAIILMTMFIKESAVTTFGAMVLIDLQLILRRDRRVIGGTPRTHLRALARPYFFVLVGVFLWQLTRWAVMGSMLPPINPADNILSGQPWHIYYSSASEAMGEYLRLLFWPARLSIDYSFNQIPLAEGMMDWQAIWPAMIAFSSILMAVAVIRRAFATGFAILFFWITFSVASNFFVLIPTLVAERLLLVPSFGACLLAALALDRLRTVPGSFWRIPLVIAVTLVIVLMSWRTVTRNLDWYSNESLFTQAAIATPNSAKVQINLGWWLRSEGRYKAALQHYNRAAQIGILHDVDFIEREIGICLHGLGRFDDAVQFYERRLAKKPKDNFTIQLRDHARAKRTPTNMHLTPRE